MKGNWKPAAAISLIIGVIVLSALGMLPSLENVIPDWIGIVALVGALVLFGKAFRDAFRLHPVRTPIGIGLILILTALAISRSM